MSRYSLGFLISVTFLAQPAVFAGLAVVRISQDIDGGAGFDGHQSLTAAGQDEESVAQPLVDGSDHGIWGDPDQFHSAFRTYLGLPGDAVDLEWAGDSSDDTLPPEHARISAGAAKLFDPAERELGFVIRVVQPAFVDGWNRDEMNKLLDFGCTGPLCLAPGMPVPAAEEGLRVPEFVNLYDSGDRGVFSAADGYPDATFPGIDPIELPAADPAAGDDDDVFATEVMAIIHLTEGLHIIGVNGDEGTVIEIGGVEIGRSPEPEDDSNSDFVFEVEAQGYYTLRARHLAGVGPAALELHEIVETDGGAWRRILLGDVANGGSAVYVPEPATVVLMGLGVWILLRRRR
jgi:hypothetical protein